MSSGDPENKDLQCVDDIDRAIHSPTRLKIMAVLQLSKTPTSLF